MLVAAIATLSCGKLYSQGSVNHSPLLKWKCENGNSTLNFNPSMMPGDSLVFDSVPYASDYTVIVVSKPLSNEETRLWQLEYGDSSMRSLTTN